MSEINEKTLELAKKLKALCDQGVGGEKQNAIKMLQNLMLKHGITYSMIEGDQQKNFDFFVTVDELNFFSQVASSVIGPKKNGRGEILQYTKKGKRVPGKDRYVIEKITDAEYVEIIAKHDFYYKTYQEEVSVFYAAFIQKQRLYVKQDDSDVDDQKELSVAEKQHILKIMSMMEGIDQKTFNKQIG